jgi:hypothetical protein
MSPKSTTIGVRVTEERREKLEEFVEESAEYESVPDLFRRAVAHELSDEYGYRNEQSESPGESETLGQVHSDVKELKSGMEEVKSAVEGIPREMQYERTRSNEEVRDDILQALPTSAREAVSTSSLSDKIDADRARTLDNIDYLHRNTGLIAKTDAGNWYREA